MMLIQEAIQKNYTTNVKIHFDMFNSFHLSSNLKKVWYNFPAKQWVIAHIKDVHCISVSWKHCRLAFQVWKYIQTSPRLTWDEHKSILVASLDDSVCDHIKTFLNESKLCWCIWLQWFTQHQHTIYTMYIISMNMYQSLSFSLCWARTLSYKVRWCC